MSKEEKVDGRIITHEHTAMFVSFETPRAFERNGKPQGEAKFGYTAFFDKNDDMKPLYAKAAAVAKAKWPDADVQPVLKRLFKDGDKEAERLKAKKVKPKTDDQVKEYKGKVIVKASSKYKPDISEVINGEAVEILDMKKVYSGMIGRAELNFVAMEIEDPNEPDGERRFVVAYVNFFLKTKQGQRIGGRDRKDVWKSVQGEASNADPTGGDDDIKF